jgi:hypothetical protein
MRSKIFNRLFPVAVVACANLLSSCANQQLLSNPTDRIEPGKDAILLMTFRISNKVKPQCEQFLEMAIFDKTGYIAKQPGLSAVNNCKEYIVSMKVPSGVKILNSLRVGSRSSILSSAVCDIPMNMTINVESEHVYYLGQIEAVLRKSKEGEPRAALLPLIDAATTGFSEGTWDITIRDNYQHDMELIKSRFPGVQGAKVDKNILPAWVRPK